MKIRRYWIVGLLVLIVALAGCGTAGQETPTPAWVEEIRPIVSVTGEVVPRLRATLSVETGGEVVEVLVEPGDEVAAGDVLIRLSATDAELEVRRAQAALAAAEARLTLLQADPQQAQVAISEAQVEATEAELARAMAEEDQLEAGATAVEIASQQATVVHARADRLAAYERHEDTMTCVTISQGGQERTICPALGPIEEQARYQLQAAEKRLEAARAELDALQAGADDRRLAAAAAVRAATAERDAAQAELDLLRASPKAEEIASQKAAVARAQAALDAAEVAFARTEIKSPLTGTVGRVDVRRGEVVSAGQPVVVVGDLSTHQVETTDLDEFDVARVDVGQPVDVTFDAIPDQVFSGQVSRIAPMAEPDGGGVNYTTVIEMEQFDPAIRWGMTAFVDMTLEE